MARQAAWVSLRPRAGPLVDGDVDGGAATAPVDEPRGRIGDPGLAPLLEVGCEGTLGPDQSDEVRALLAHVFECERGLRIGQGLSLIHISEPTRLLSISY